MTKAEIAQLASDRGYSTVDINDTKDNMIIAFLAEQGN